ncbi:MAG: protoglobin domain-containing protein [Gammaproteobacteria bacterium]|nr:protoglobin domain-containing protein [Gammaproteobacteria bacterium]
MDPSEIEQRKQWLELSAEDEACLARVDDKIKNSVHDIVDSLYEHFMKFEQPRKFFEDLNVLKRVKNLQKEYFLRLTEGNYDTEYVEERLKIGATHANINLDVKWYLGAYNFYLRAISEKIFEAYKHDQETALKTIFALKKLIFLDIGLAIDTYIYQRESTIRKQQEAIRELSTPVLQVRDGLLILPIIGAIDSLRARQLTEQLLYAIRDRRALVVVVDVTGVPTIDSRVANHLMQTVEASRLMGAKTIITGLSAEVAQTLVNVGVDLSRVTTVGDLQGGIEEADQILGNRNMTYAERRPGKTEESFS